MAVYRPTLLGNTEADITPFFGGFVDAGAAQMNQSIQNFGRTVAEAKNKKFEQAQNLRDGIVSGHFSDAMASSVEGYIKELSELPTYSKEYAAKLAEANADLGIKVARQSQITKGIDEIQASNDKDPSKKYYDNTSLNARMYDQINGDTELGIQGTGIDTTNEDLQNAYKDFRNNINNIKDGEVRNDFQTRLGEIVQKIESTGGLENVNSEFAKFTRTTTGDKFVTGYKYDPTTRSYIPAFDQDKLPPMGLVELYRGVDNAASILMDDFVNNMHKTKSDDPDKPISPAAKQMYERRFLLEEMKKLAPGGSIQQSEDTSFSRRATPNDAMTRQQYDQDGDYHMMNDVLNRIEEARMMDPDQMEAKGNIVNYVDIDVDGNGNTTRMLDLSGLQGLDIPVAKQVTRDATTDQVKESFIAPEGIYLDVDPDTNLRTLYMKTGDGEDAVYTAYNERNVSQLALNLSTSLFGGTKPYKNWSLESKRRGTLSDDGQFSTQKDLSSKTTKARADVIRKQDAAVEGGAPVSNLDPDDLRLGLEQTSPAKIDEGLQPITNFLAREGYDQVGLTDKDGKQVTDSKVKFVNFKREGTYFFNNMANSYGTLEYQTYNNDGTLNPTVKTVKYKTDDMISNITGKPQTFDLKQER